MPRVPLSRRPRLRALVLAALMLAACAGTNGDNSQSESRTGERIGTIVGAIGGAILGSRLGEGATGTLGAVAGGALGAYLGGNLGRMFDERDRELQARAADEAMTRSPGEGVSWSNPESGNSGKVTPLSEPRRTESGKTCRAFEQQVRTGDGRTDARAGTACRQSDGTWHVVTE